MNEQELLKKIQGLIDESQKGTVKREDLEAKVAEINKEISEKLNDKQIKALKDSVDVLIASQATLEAAIKAINEKAVQKTEAPMNFKEAIRQAILEKAGEVPGLLVDRNDDFGQRKSLKPYFEKGNRVSPTITVKALVDMLQSNIVQSNVATVRLAELDPNRVGIPLTLYPHVFDFMPSKGIKRPTMSILVVYEYEDGSGTKTEGTAPSKSSFKLKTVEFKSFNIATYFVLSTEALDDLDEVLDEISVTGPDKIRDNVDSQILGTAGDDSSAIAGLFTANKKTDFAATWNGLIPAATTVDLIEKAKLQAENNKYRPDVVLINPTDLSAIGADKDQMDNSKTDRRVAYNNIGEPVYICGLRVIKNTAVTADTLAVADSKQLMLGLRKDVSLEIGYNGTDFTEGQKTVMISVRVAFGVRDKAAVIYSSGIAAAVAALTKA